MFPNSPELTPSKESVPTDAVSILFGSHIGSLADFGCTHRRIRGRLYITEEAVLFYSNLLGFETRIAVLLADIDYMELCRTTSIELQLCDGEVYTFRSFQNREEVFQVLSRLKRKDDVKKNRKTDSLSSPTHGTGLVRSKTLDPAALASMRSASTDIPSTPVRLASAEPSEDDSLDEQSLTSSVATPLRSNRRRAASENSIASPPHTPDAHLGSSVLSQKIDFNGSESQDYSSSTDQITSPDMSAESMEKEWRAALHVQQTIGTEHIGIESLELPCSLHSFFESFLADNAPHSMEQFQREQIGDKDIRLSPWTHDEVTGVDTRSMTFIHPIKNSMGMGPSEALTSRKQKMRRFGALGLTLENTTQVEGVPVADAFFVRDHWLVESLDDGERVRLTTRFGAHFHKRVLFKGFIEKSVYSQTTEWYATYARLLTDVMQEEKVTDFDESKMVSNHTLDQSTDHFQALECSIMQMKKQVMVCAFVLLLVFVQLFVLSWNVAKLRSEVARMGESTFIVSATHSTNGHEL